MLRFAVKNFFIKTKLKHVMNLFLIKKCVNNTKSLESTVLKGTLVTIIINLHYYNYYNKENKYRDKINELQNIGHHYK